MAGTLAVVVLGWLGGSACSADEAVSRIDVLVSEQPPGLGRPLALVRLSVSRALEATGGRFFEQATTYEGASLAPVAFRVAPEREAHAGSVLYRFVAQGVADGQVLVEARARLVFVPGRSVVLPLRFYGECVERECPADTTCAPGGCLDDYLPACALAGAGGSSFCEGMDARIPVPPPADAAGPETGVEAGSDAARDSGARDSGPDAARDSGARDSGPDAARDSGARDSGPDAARDSGARDSGPDAARDSGPDAARDSGAADSGIECTRREDCPPDGLGCTDVICIGARCAQAAFPGWCVIGGACWGDGALDPDNHCARCDPSTNRESWTPIPGCV